MELCSFVMSTNFCFENVESIIFCNSDTPHSLFIFLVLPTRFVQVVSQPIPAPTKRQSVRVRVEAAGANFFDHLMCRGEYQTKPPLPFIPGTEFAGVVDAIAADANVSNVKVGKIELHGEFDDDSCFTW